MKFNNASQKPKRYFGLHFVKGLAEYQDANFNNGEPYKILVGEEVMKKMDKSFEGCPVYVQHVDEVNMKNLQNEADGYVVKSFYNKSDGNHWVEFIVVSDKGHQAIANGWSLSNAYFMMEPVGIGGTWHAIEYKQELLNGEFEHLAIVPNPRYQESGEIGLLTPEQFKEYCEKKDSTLTLLQNSKNNTKDAGDQTMLKFFKKNAVEDKEAKELAGMTVTLPKSKIDVELSKLVNDADEKEMKKNDKMYADDKHMVKINDDEEMSVEELKNKYNEMSKKNDDDEEIEVEEEKQNDDDADKKDDVKNEDEKEEKAEEKKKNAADEKEARMKKKNDLKDAAKKQNQSQVETVFMSSKDKVELGKNLY
jgi:hypothetical protein